MITNNDSPLQTISLAIEALCTLPHVLRGLTVALKPPIHLPRPWWPLVQGAYPTIAWWPSKMSHYHDTYSVQASSQRWSCAGNLNIDFGKEHPLIPQLSSSTFPTTQTICSNDVALARNSCKRSFLWLNIEEKGTDLKWPAIWTTFVDSPPHGP